LAYPFHFYCHKLHIFDCALFLPIAYLLPGRYLPAAAVLLLWTVTLSKLNYASGREDPRALCELQWIEWNR
jgi:hypothetical protein